VTQPLTGVGGVSAAEAPTAARPAEDKAAREAAEGFERLLLGQLTRTLLDSALPADSASAATGAYKSQLPDALTEALMSGGGIGLAQTLKGVDG
jgi:Rod binding domain-containing protein